MKTRHQYVPQEMVKTWTITHITEDDENLNTDIVSQEMVKSWTLTHLTKDDKSWTLTHPTTTKW